MADADYIPFIPGENNYELTVPLGGDRVVFQVRWNSTDNDHAGAWYFDIFAEDGSVIAVDIKVVLGVNLGRRSSHPFFARHILRAIDTTGKGKEAAYDDLGRRVQVVHATTDQGFYSS